MTNIGWKFDNSYPQLSENLISRIVPTKVKSPKIVIINYDLAKQLGLDFSLLNNEELAKLFTGNEIPKGSDPLANGLRRSSVWSFSYFR